MKKYKKGQTFIVLTTDKSAPIAKYLLNDLLKGYFKAGHMYSNLKDIWNDDFKPYHFYITTEDVKVNGDWCIHPDSLNISRHHDKENNLQKGWKKIVITSDSSLSFEIKDKELVVRQELFPYPHEKFIEKFRKIYNKGLFLRDVLIECKELTEEDLGCDPAYYPLEERLEIAVCPIDNTAKIRRYKQKEISGRVRQLLWKAYTHNSPAMSPIKIHNELIPEFCAWLDKNL